MKKNLFFGFTLLLLLAISLGNQGSVGSEDELKAKANELFEAENYKEAKLMYAQLLSLYPKDPTYNYRFGACVLQTESDKTKPMKYLSFATSKATVDPLAYFYLGKAYHLNYEFAKAVKQYSNFKNKADNDEREKYSVDRQIEMCKNGNDLLKTLNEVQVLERQTIAEKDFYRIYDEKAIGGKIIVKPEQFKSKYDKKSKDKSVVFLPTDAKEVYYSSYGKKGDNGKDIYKAIKLGNGEWSEGVSLGNSINTPFDEDYAFIKPDGRTLYFASKGHTSMGGFDVFKSVLDEATGQWTQPENLDFAFNSADDDFMFVTDRAEITAYFTSNRVNEFGEVTVYKVLTERAPAELSVISGTFIAEGDPTQKKAKITVIDKVTQETIGVYETDAKGYYAIEIAKNGGEYQFNVETNEKDPIHTGVVSIPRQDKFEVLGQELRLVGIGNEQQLVIKNIFDGTATNNIAATGGPVISSELIKLKANLEVNYNSNDLAKLQERIEDSKSSTSEIIEDVEEPLDVVEEMGSDAIEMDTQKGDPTATADVSGAEAANDERSTAISVVELEKELNTLRAERNEQIDSKQGAVGNQFNIALKLEQEATDLFQQAQKMKMDGADTAEINEKRKEAGEKALKASVAASLAQDIETSINEDLAYLEEFESAELDINQSIGENNLQLASKKLEEVKAKDKGNSDVKSIIAISLRAIEERDALADKKMNDFTSKSTSFEEERNSLKNQLISLNEQLEKSNGKKKEELNSSKENIELDLKDLDYQVDILNKNLKDANLSKKSLVLEREEVVAASDRFNSEVTETGAISEEEKNNLFNQLKKYREGNQLAYAAGNDLYAADESIFLNEVDSEEVTEEAQEISNANPSNLNSEQQEVQSVSNNEESIESYEYQTSFSINTKYTEELEATEDVVDEDLKLANKIQVYENWLNDLQKKRLEVKNTYESEIDESKRSVWKTELDELSTSINEQQKAKKDAELELDARASGQFVANSSPITNLNEITEESIVDADFSNLLFDQKVKATNAQTALHLIEAKQTLFEASELAKQQEIAQELAYTAPTAEERTQAFAKANMLKSGSEAKQIEAAYKFATFNRKEYQLNREKINSANSMDARFTTDGRDIAILLSEEANDFFTDAAILRAEINETDRLSQKEVSLQKAYDYELLGLEKQKAALEKLGMVVSESLSEESSRENKVVKPFIQVIEDETILSVVEAPKAKEAAERKTAKMIDVSSQIEAEQSVAATMENETERDSVLALVQNLKEEKDQLLKDAALYYERERQIKEGLVGVKPANNSSVAQVLAPVKPAIEVTLDTVDVDGERERIVIESADFKSFANNRQKLMTQTKAAVVAYEEAVTLAEENERLQKQAIMESSMANVVKDEGEKQRLLKSAQVIESKIESNENKIESINNSIKVKNILIQSLVEKDRSYLAALGETEKQEYVYLSNNFLPDPISADLIAEVPSSAAEDLEYVGLVEGDETAAEPLEINSITPNNDNADINYLEATGEDDVIGITESFKTNADEPIVDEEQISASPDNKVDAIGSSEVVKTVTPNRAVAETANTSIGIENIDVVPREVKQAIFVTLNKNESAYGESKPIPTQTSLPEGIVYKIQVGAFRKEIPANTFKGFAPLMAEPTGTGITRYTAGLFAKENNAIAARDEIRKIGYPDAFVVAFLNGQRISVAKARAESGTKEPTASAIAFPKINESSTGNLANKAVSADEVTQVSGGSKEALPEAFSSSEIEEVVNAKTVEGLYYTIQIGVFSTPVKKGSFNYEGLNVVQLQNGLFRYNAGMFNSVLQAADLKNTITTTIKDAFVTAYYNGKRISLTEASKLKNQ
jgi:hypothetical protein